MKIIPFTENGLKDINNKLQEQILKRPDTVKSLSRAREMGDLSENGLYKAAKFELSDIDRLIRYYKNLIKYSKIISPTDNKTIQIGHNITVKSENGSKNFYIVGEYEANPREGKISYKSPIGHNLMGRNVGDKVFIKTPSGGITYIIEKIFKI
jgi:transcription elongation factor GreA